MADLRAAAWDLLHEAERLYDGEPKAEMMSIRKLKDIGEGKKRVAQFHVDYPEYLAAFDSLCNFLADNFVREMSETEEEDAIAEISHMLREVAIEDLPNLTVSDIAFPVLLMRAALFPDRICVVQTPAWKNLAPNFTRLVMAA